MKNTITILACVGITCSLTNAQSFDSSVDTKTSSANIESMIVFDSTGTLIGDFDSKTNPSGTQTRLGLFGGSGNQPIDTSVSVGADSSLDTNPTGSFVVSPDFDLGIIEIDGLVVDLLNGSPSETDLSITMLYSSFHTVSPTFIYPGGVPITLPIGQIGGISEAIITQTLLGAGTLTPTADPSIFDVAMLMTAELDMTFDASLPGQDPTQTPIDALPIVLPIAGQIEMIDSDTISITLEIMPDAITFAAPIDGVALPDVPFELPTFGTDTAGVLFSPTPESINVDALLSLTINAFGHRSDCLADLTGDGLLNFFDVSAFLSAFNAMESVADFTGDGLYNFFDVSAFLSAFNEGCP